MAISEAQIWSRKRFGYGMYVMSAMGDKQGLNHAWYLQNKQPGIPKYESTWSWTEFDWEFVPQCNSATPINRIECKGSALPFSTIKPHNVIMTSFSGSPGALEEVSGQRTDQSFAKEVVTKQWAWMAAHGPANIDWPTIDPSNKDYWKFVISNLFLKPNNIKTNTADGWKTLSTFDISTIGWGNPSYPASSDCLMTIPTYIIGSPANPTAMDWPQDADLTSAISVNIINAAKGTTPLISYNESADTYSIDNSDALFVPVLLNSSNLQKGEPQDLWQFFYSTSTGSLAPGQGYPGRQSFIYAKGGATVFDPASNFYDYTIVWTPEYVAFYINPVGEGTNITGTSPVYVMTLDDNPTVPNFGLGAVGADNTFWYQDYDNENKLGELFISFQLWNMGNKSFAGPQTGDGAMHVKSAAFYSHQSGDGKKKKDFSTTADFAIEFTDFTSNDQCLQELTQKFAILNGGAYHADNVSWVKSGPDGNPSLKLVSELSAGASSEWYGLGPANWASKADFELSEQVVCKIDNVMDAKNQQYITYASSASGEDADWFKVSGSSSATPISTFLHIKNPAANIEAKASITFTSDKGLSQPNYQIGTPIAGANTNNAQAIQLFSGINGKPQVISPQLYQ